MEFDDIVRARTLMQPIDILRNQREVRHAALQFGERRMAGIRLRRTHAFAPPFVPVPYQRRIALERLGRRQFFRTEACPQSGLCFTEGRDTAFGAYAGTGENGD